MKRRLSLDLSSGIAILANGERTPITTMLDERSEETQCPSRATAIVAGPLRSGKWLAAEVLEAERQAVSLPS